MKHWLYIIYFSYFLTVSGPIAYGEVPSFAPNKSQATSYDLTGITRLRFLTTVDFPPFNSLDSHGGLKGYHIDLIRVLCKQLDLESICQIEALPWNFLQEKLLNGEGEAIIAGLGPSANNRTELAFSRPYLRLPARFVTQTANSFSTQAAIALSNKRVGVIAASAHEILLHHYMPDSIAVPFDDREHMLDALKTGSTDAAFDDGMALSFWLDGSQANGCCAFSDGPYLAPQFLGSGFTIAVPQENARLVTAFDKALHVLEKNGTLAELYLRYFPVGFY